MRSKKRPTIADVARAANVSEATVSRVLKGQAQWVRPETRERVLRAVVELGYVPSAPARALRTNRTFTLGLVIPDITNPFWPETARGVQDAAHREGYSVFLGNTDWKREREWELVMMACHNRMDGLIINPTWVTADELAGLGMPVVILGQREGFSRFDMVGVDVAQGIELAVKHLVGLGHERIGLITGPLETTSARSRLEGYRAALERCGIPFREEFVASAPFTQEGGGRALEGLLSRTKPPTAVVAANDVMAIGALLRAKELGVRVPEELSLIGFDDIKAASVTSPPLTTVTYPKRERGETAVRFLIERIEGVAPPVGRRRIYPCELVVRGTTAPPARG
jgi:DNA-binding LacI/PurR family transcriptional regulator